MKTTTVKKSAVDKAIEREIIRSENEHKKSVKKTISKKDKIKSIMMTAVNKMSDNSLNHLYAALIVGGPMIVLKMGADEISSGMWSMEHSDNIKKRKQWDKAISIIKQCK